MSWTSKVWCVVAVIFLFVAFGCGGSRAAFSVARTGTFVIAQTYGMDFDALSDNPGRFDIWFEAVRESEMYLTPLRRSKVALLDTVSEASAETCVKADLQQKKIPFAELREGKHVCVVSNEGRYADLRIDKIKPPTAPTREGSAALTVTYTIWDKK